MQCSITVHPIVTILDLSIGTVLSFNWTQSRALSGLVTGHNTLRRLFFYVMGMINSALCRRCGAEEKTSALVVCDCEALTSIRHSYLFGLLSLGPKGR